MAATIDAINFLTKRTNYALIHVHQICVTIVLRGHVPVVSLVRQTTTPNSLH